MKGGEIVLSQSHLVIVEDSLHVGFSLPRVSVAGIGSLREGAPHPQNGVSPRKQLGSCLS